MIHFFIAFIDKLMHGFNLVSPLCCHVMFRYLFDYLFSLFFLNLTEKYWLNANTVLVQVTTLYQCKQPQVNLCEEIKRVKKNLTANVAPIVRKPISANPRFEWKLVFKYSRTCSRFLFRQAGEDCFACSHKNH